MNLITVTPPPVEPVTLQDLYDFLRLDPFGSPPEHPDDAMLLSMLRGAREKVEQTTRRAMVSQRLRLILPGAPIHRVFWSASSVGDFFEHPGSVTLPKPPLIEVHAVTYYDRSNQLQTLDPASYFVATDVEPAVLSLVEGQFWPDTYARADAFQVEYTAGYAPAGSPPDDLAANVPDLLKSAVKLDVQLQYDEIAPEKRTQLIEAFNRMLVSFTMPKF